MATSPQLTPNSVAALLPVIFFILLIIALFFLLFSIKTNDFPDFLKLLQDSSPTPTTTILPKSTVIPSSPTLKITATSTPKPVAICYHLTIREGEFTSNKCYSKTNFDNLNYYLQRFDSATFDLQTAQGSISITCNCRNQQECDFFKDNCSQAQSQKSQAEANITKYRSMIKSIISQGK